MIKSKTENNLYEKLRTFFLYTKKEAKKFGLSEAEKDIVFQKLIKDLINEGIKEVKEKNPNFTENEIKEYESELKNLVHSFLQNIQKNNSSQK